ncbi:hypothetical protein PRZ48_006052 [Zasmidium cellare]|uniref:Cyanuric acid amidohydrolase n=1 Tax=Zasmidium cellare TaxID=395010 RepID=A0ABR0ENA0_ZASCE|nr:hypothetical protein PRZ48_006052 [Zasmidium cellare]
MPPATILKFPTSSPADTTPLTRLQEAGFKTQDILGIVGKTEGNGCVNDFSRTLSSHVWDALIPETAISIFSGGTEGVLSPHVTCILESYEPTGLNAAVTRSRVLEPWEVGTAEHAKAVTESIRETMIEENIQPGDVRLVLVKCPLLTSERIATIQGSGRKPVTLDTYESMALSRYASAIGIGAAIETFLEPQIPYLLSKGDFQTPFASCSSGAELEDCHILILSDSRYTPSPPAPLLRTFTSTLNTAIDFPSLQALLTKALTPTAPYTTATLLQVFAKAEANPSGLVGGRFRHTMLTDSDLHSTRHARAAVGGLIAGVTGDCWVYVSGGAEGT